MIQKDQIKRRLEETVDKS